MPPPIAFRAGSVALKKGEMFVVPKGREHKPFAANECQALLVEPAGTINTGDAGGDMTADDTVWIGSVTLRFHGSASLLLRQTHLRDHLVVYLGSLFYRLDYGHFPDSVDQEIIGENHRQI